MKAASTKLHSHVVVGSDMSINESTAIVDEKRSIHLAQIDKAQVCCATPTIATHNVILDPASQC
jgi:hypothetical protein